MSRELNQLFVSDPKSFANQRPVVAPGQTANSERKEIKTWQDLDEKFKGVPGEVRVIAADLNVAGSHAYLDLEYQAVAAKINEGWMALYYLPWLEGNHIRTTLRPRKSKEGRQPMAAANGYQKDVNDPDIFFTAAVNGCMISITGPVDEPTVYHSNAGISAPNPIGSEQDERIAHMSGELKKFMQLKQNKPRSANQPITNQAVTAAMYMPIGRQNDLLNKERQMKSETQAHKDKKMLGTIFGKRTDGAWAFYYERLVQFEEFDLKKGRGPRLRRRANGSQWLACLCQENRGTLEFRRTHISVGL